MVLTSLRQVRARLSTALRRGWRPGPLFAFVALPLLTACGQTGDLYPPAAEPVALDAVMENETHA